MKKLLHVLRRLAVVCSTSVVALVCLLVGCQDRLIYFPRRYPHGAVAEWQRQSQHEVLTFETSAGTQKAYLQRGSAQPERLWLVCGGNGTLALEWSQWLQDHGPAGDAYLLMEIPGYGECSGKASPKQIQASLRAAVPLAMEHLGWSAEHDRSKLRFFGHSLGAAVVLLGAEAFDIRRGVLLAPFSSTMAMCRHMTRLPLGFLVTHRFDNVARLKALARHDDLRVEIFHGTNDEVIPYAMSHVLQAVKPGAITCREVAGAQHNSLPEQSADELSAAMRSVR